MNVDRTRRPELLAPAGDWDALRAAMANGADAVYFGLPLFNARHRATNFTEADLPRVMDELHRHNVRGFVAFNTLIFPDELPRAAEYARQLAAAGVDAVIVQDLGLAWLLQRMVPGLEVHASTQMTLSEPRGIAVAAQLGLKRVVLPRELSTAEIGKVIAATSMPVEVFVHGALCVAYSGQCLTSEALGGRSANRGQCAQACRLPYEMIVDGAPRDLGDRAYLLSPQDLAGYAQVDELARLGVASLKIEGRLKTAAYVAATTQTYRAALDTQGPYEPPPEQLHDLQQTFSRGFTPGFLDGIDHQRLVRGRVPKSRGVQVGVVTAVAHGHVTVRLAPADATVTLVKPGDGIVFDIGHPEQDEPGGRVYAVEPAGPGLVRLRFGRDSGPNLAAVRAGHAIFKTDDPAVRKRMEQSFAVDRVVHWQAVHATLRGRLGEPLQLILADDEGHRVEAAWPGPLERARQHPLTTESAHAALDRLGDTPFRLGSVTLDLPDPVMVPRSVLNDLRRQVTADLLEQRLRSRIVPVVEADALEQLRKAVPRGPTGNEGLHLHLHLLVRTEEQLTAALAWQPPTGVTLGTLWCDFEDGRRYRDAVTRGRVAGVTVGPATLRILKPGEDGLLRPLIAAEPDAVLVRNLGSLALLREALPAAELVGDFSLNVANDLTAAWLIGQGLTRLVPSYDLNWEQLQSLARRFDPTRLEVVVHHHMPMFHTEHCVFAAFLSTGKDWRDCGRPCDRHRVDLHDRVGAAFPVVADTGCRNTVYNSLPQSAAEYIGRMRELGVRHLRVELLRESAEQVGPLLDAYAQVALGGGDARHVWREVRAVNRLGLTRGTLQLV